MGASIGVIIVSIILIFIMIIVIRAILFQPKMMKEVLIPPFSLDQKNIVDNMVQQIGRAHV